MPNYGIIQPLLDTAKTVKPENAFGGNMLSSNPLPSLDKPTQVTSFPGQTIQGGKTQSQPMSKIGGDGKNPMGGVLNALAGAKGGLLSDLTKTVAQNPSKPGPQQQGQQPAQSDAPQAPPMSQQPDQEAPDEGIFPNEQQKQVYRGLSVAMKHKVAPMYQTMQQQGMNPRLVNGTRTVDEQTDRYTRGLSKGMYNSKHLTGNAADIIHGDQGYMAPQEWWNQVGQHAQNYGLSWNNDDPSHIDMPGDEYKLQPGDMQQDEGGLF